MHQTAHNRGLSASEHLEREWQLFQTFEAGARGHRCLVWEATRPVVVVGRNTPAADQVVLEACREDRVAVLRRSSGGGAVVLAPGCLNYAVGISLVSTPVLADVASSFATILGRIAAALEISGLAVAGETDLALNGRKVSGNAQRRGRATLLHHGTLLYGFDPALAHRYLREPARQPAYRARRRHADFLANLPLSKDALADRLLGACRDLGLPLSGDC
jgi:lipoate---protein ligase